MFNFCQTSNKPSKVCLIAKSGHFDFEINLFFSFKWQSKNLLSPPTRKKCFLFSPANFKTAVFMQNK